MKSLNFLTEDWEQMGSNIALGLSQFIFGIEELQQISRERKMLREKIKEGKFKEKEREKEKEGE